MLNQIVTQLESSPNTAFVIDDKPSSYQELDLLVKRFYHYMKDHSELELIGIVMHNDLDTYAFMVATVLSDCGYVILNPEHPGERNALIASQAGLVRIVSSVEADRCLVPGCLEFYWMQAIPAPDVLVCFTEPNPESTAYVLFTSGSTGTPKGVRISKRNLNALIESFFAIPIPITSSDRVLQMFDLTFDGSVLMLFLPLCKGATVYTTDPARIKYLDIARIVLTHCLTFVFVVPSVISLLKPLLPSLHFPSVKTFVVGAEACTYAQLEAVKPAIPNATIWNLYGPTEATVCVLAYRVDTNTPNELFNGVIPIGKPTPGVKHLIIDVGVNAGSPKNEPNIINDIGVHGELYIGGSQLSDGYINNPARNHPAFIDCVYQEGKERFFATGDIVYLNQYGNYVYCGRKDRQVKIQGHRIELAELEYQANRFTGSQAVALAKETDGIPQLSLVIENYSGSLEAVKEHLELQLPAYMVPKTIITTGQIPLTTSGKTDLNKLNEMLCKEISPK